MHVVINHEHMHKQESRIDTRYLKINLSLLMPLSGYNPLLALRTQL